MSEFGMFILDVCIYLERVSMQIVFQFRKVFECLWSCSVHILLLQNGFTKCTSTVKIWYHNVKKKASLFLWPRETLLICYIRKTWSPSDDGDEKKRQAVSVEDAKLITSQLQQVEVSAPGLQEYEARWCVFLTCKPPAGYPFVKLQCSVVILF